MKTQTFVAALCSLLLSSFLPAQSPHFHMAKVGGPPQIEGFVLIGHEVYSPECPGCGAVTPQTNDDNDEWHDLPEIAGTAPGSAHEVLPGNAGSLMAWTCGHSEHASTMSVFLDKITVTNKTGDCQYLDASHTCKNGEPCEYEFELSFTVWSNDPMAASFPITITLPGLGEVTLLPLHHEETFQGSDRYSTSVSVEKLPGCGRTIFWELRPGDMLPHSTLHPDSEPIVDGGYEDEIEFKLRCENCDPEPAI